MPDLLNAGLSWVFIGLLVLALWWAVRELRGQTHDHAELYTYMTYRPARRRLTGHRERPLSWDHFHDDYE